MKPPTPSTPSLALRALIVTAAITMAVIVVSMDRTPPPAPPNVRTFQGPLQEADATPGGYEFGECAYDANGTLIREDP